MLIILTLLTFTIRASVLFDFDVLKNSGSISIRLFLFPIYKAKIYFENHGITKNNLIIEYKNKKNEIHINNDKSDKQSIISVMTGFPIFSAIDVKDVYIDFYMGKQDDAFFTTLLTLGIKVVLYSALAFIKSYYNTEIAESFNAIYNDNVFKLDGFGIITGSIADIIVSAITTFKRAFGKKIKKEKILSKRSLL